MIQFGSTDMGMYSDDILKNFFSNNKKYVSIEMSKSISVTNYLKSTLLNK